MTRATTTELLAGKRARLIAAHPDDSIWSASLGAGYLDEALLSRGEQGRGGRTIDRVAEELRAAPLLGIQAVRLHPGTDGNLQHQVEPLAAQVAEAALEDGIEVLIGNELLDHPDHRAAGRIAIRAARVAAARGQRMEVLLLQPGQTGSHRAPATPDTMERAFMAASQHASQWEIRQGIHEDWPIVPGGYSMHPDDFRSLRQYPLLTDAAYNHHVFTPHTVAGVADPLEYGILVAQS